MKRFLPLLFVLLACISPTPSARAESKPRSSVKLLTIGNSFAINSLHYLPEFARSSGKQLTVFPANLGGHTLQAHAGYVDNYERNPDDPKGHPYKNLPDPKTGQRKDFSLKEALQSDNWDYVTIQQLSDQSFKPESYEPYAGKLISYIRQYAPTAEPLVIQTWAWRQDYPGYGKNGFTMESMYSGLVSAYDQVAKRYGLRIVPIGAAFQAARQTPRWTYHLDPKFDFQNPPAGKLPDQTGSLNVGWSWHKVNGEDKLVLDQKHANDAGEFLAAAVFYEVLFGEPPTGNLIYKGGTAEDSRQLLQIAHETVQKQAAVK